MLLGPVFSVEMVTSSRRTRYFAVRALYGSVLLLAFWMVYESHFGYYTARTTDIASVANFTAAFFNAFAVLQLLAIALLGPAMAAGTIATERERRTIEYLFVANLSNLEIVFGKLAARLLQIVSLVLVGLPILALAMLLGGIAPEALVVAFLITVSTVLAVATLSIAVSVWSARAREAVTRAYLVLLALFLVPPILSMLQYQAGAIYDKLLAPINEHLLASNPFWILQSVLSGASASGYSPAWQTVGILLRNHLMLSVGALVAATIAVRPVHLHQTGLAPKRRRRLMHLLRPKPDNHPMLWKEIFAEPAASRLGLVGRIALAAIVLGVLGPTLYMFVTTVGNYGLNDTESFQTCSLIMGSVVGCGALLLIAARAAGAVTSEKERACWDSLISTPLSPHQIVLAKILGNIYALRGAMVILLLIWGMGVIVDTAFLKVVPFLLGTLLIVALFAGSLGVMFSLWCKSSLRSMGLTLVVGVFFGGAYLFCCVPVIFLEGGEELFLAPCVPFLLAFPGVLYMEGARILEYDPELVAAYVLGNLAYLVTALLLYGGSVGNFDSLTGRTGRYAFHPDGPPRSPEIMVAEVVDTDE